VSEQYDDDFPSFDEFLAQEDQPEDDFPSFDEFLASEDPQEEVLPEEAPVTEPLSFIDAPSRVTSFLDPRPSWEQQEEEIEPASVTELSEDAQLGVKNNNWLNITQDDDNDWIGQSGDDGKFVTFKDPVYGVRAADRLIENYHSKHDIDTISGVISRFAPSEENPTDSYIDFVSGATGIPRDQSIDLADPEVRGEVLKAMVAFETPDAAERFTPELLAEARGIEEGVSRADLGQEEPSSKFGYPGFPSDGPPKVDESKYGYPESFDVPTAEEVLDFFNPEEGVNMFEAGLEGISQIGLRTTRYLGGLIQQSGEESEASRMEDYLGGRGVWMSADEIPGIAMQAKAEGQSTDDFLAARAEEQLNSPLARLGEEIAADAMAELEERAPDVVPGTAPYYAFHTLAAVSDMAGPVVAGIITRSPNFGLALIGTQVYGSTYAESRAKGHDIDRSNLDAFVYTASEVLTEKIPMGVLTKEGSYALQRILRSAVAEGIQEPINAAIQMAYDIGMSPDITFKEAMQDPQVRQHFFDVLKESMIVGAGAGGVLGTVAAGMHSLIDRISADAEQIHGAPTMDDAIRTADELIAQDIADPPTPLWPGDAPPEGPTGLPLIPLTPPTTDLPGGGEVTETPEIPATGSGTIEIDGKTFEYEDGKIIYPPSEGGLPPPAGDLPPSGEGELPPTDTPPAPITNIFDDIDIDDVEDVETPVVEEPVEAPPVPTEVEEEEPVDELPAVKDAGKLGAGSRDRSTGVGKKMGDSVYMHISYAEDLDGFEYAKSLLPEGFNPNTIRYNPKTGEFAFYETEEFDTHPEPTAGRMVTVSTQTGEATEPKDNDQIFHHKWQWVKDDYEGFDVGGAAQRSVDWQTKANETGTSRSNIGRKNIWNQFLTDQDLDPNEPGTAPEVKPAGIESVYLKSDRDYLTDPEGNDPVTGTPTTVKVYQGSGREEAGSVYTEGDRPVFGDAFYGALTAQNAEEFGPNIQEREVTLQNPLVISSNEGMNNLLIQSGVTEELYEIEQMQEAATKMEEWLRASHHDGVIINLGMNDMDTAGKSNKRLREWFSTSQVIAFDEPSGPAPGGMEITREKFPTIETFIKERGFKEDELPFAGRGPYPEDLPIMKAIREWEKQTGEDYQDYGKPMPPGSAPTETPTVEAPAAEEPTEELDLPTDYEGMLEYIGGLTDAQAQLIATDLIFFDVDLVTAENFGDRMLAEDEDGSAGLKDTLSDAIKRVVRSGEGAGEAPGPTEQAEEAEPAETVEEPTEITEEPVDVRESTRKDFYSGYRRFSGVDGVVRGERSDFRHQILEYARQQAAEKFKSKGPREDYVATFLTGYEGGIEPEKGGAAKAGYAAGKEYAATHEPFDKEATTALVKKEWAIMEQELVDEDLLPDVSLDLTESQLDAGRVEGFNRGAELKTEEYSQESTAYQGGFRLGFFGDSFRIDSWGQEDRPDLIKRGYREGRAWAQEQPAVPDVQIYELKEKFEALVKGDPLKDSRVLGALGSIRSYDPDVTEKEKKAFEQREAGFKAALDDPAKPLRKGSATPRVEGYAAAKHIMRDIVREAYLKEIPGSTAWEPTHYMMDLGDTVPVVVSEVNGTVTDEGGMVFPLETVKDDLMPIPAEVPEGQKSQAELLAPWNDKLAELDKDISHFPLLPTVAMDELEKTGGIDVSNWDMSNLVTLAENFFGVANITGRNSKKEIGDAIISTIKTGESFQFEAETESQRTLREGDTREYPEATEEAEGFVPIEEDELAQFAEDMYYISPETPPDFMGLELYSEAEYRELVQKLGEDLTVGGDITMIPSPELGVTVGGYTSSINPPWFQDAELRLKNLSITRSGRENRGVLAWSIIADEYGAGKTDFKGKSAEVIEYMREVINQGVTEEWERYPYRTDDYKDITYGMDDKQLAEFERTLRVFPRGARDDDYQRPIPGEGEARAGAEGGTAAGPEEATGPPESGGGQAEEGAADTEEVTDNTIFTDEMRKWADDVIDSYFRSTTMGSTRIDPEVMAATVVQAGHFIESGFRSFIQYARKMVQKFGAGIKPYLQIAYEEARGKVAAEDAAEMETPEQVQTLTEKYFPEAAAATVGESVETPAGVDPNLEGIDLANTMISWETTIEDNGKAVEFPSVPAEIVMRHQDKTINMVKMLLECIRK